MVEELDYVIESFSAPNEEALVLFVWHWIFQQILGIFEDKYLMFLFLQLLHFLQLLELLHFLVQLQLLALVVRAEMGIY